MIQALAVELERLSVACGALLEIAPLTRVELQAEFAGDLAGDFILDGEDVSGRRIEALRPDGFTGCGSEQLNTDAYAAARLLQAAGQNGLGIKVAGGFQRITVALGIFANGANWPDLQLASLADLGDERVG